MDSISFHKKKQQEIKHIYLPKKFIYNYELEDRSFFTELNGTLYLPDANNKKRLLLNFFYKAIEKLQTYSNEQFQDIKNFLESIYCRDYIWNFRDVATINTKLKPNKIFRSSSLSRYHSENFFADFVRRYKINKIIDLRSEDEYKKCPYNSDMLNFIEHLFLSIDPKQQSDEFKQKYHYGSNEQIAYRYFAIECKHIFKSIFEMVDPLNDVVLIHCFAGKDRTGVVVALLCLLVGEHIENIQNDYLASEMDSNIDNLNIFLELIQNRGINNYLLDCGINLDRINQWRSELSK